MTDRQLTLEEAHADELLAIARKVAYRVHVWPVEREDAAQTYLVCRLHAEAAGKAGQEAHRLGVNGLRRFVRAERRERTFFSGVRS